MNLNIVLSMQSLLNSATEDGKVPNPFVKRHQSFESFIANVRVKRISTLESCTLVLDARAKP
jgi:hypothetical protein